MCRRKPEQSNRKKARHLWKIVERLRQLWEKAGDSCKALTCRFHRNSDKSHKRSVISAGPWLGFDLDTFQMQVGYITAMLIYKSMGHVILCLCSYLVCFGGTYILFWFNFTLNLPLLLMYKCFLLLCSVKKQYNGKTCLCCSHS
jgi:hypothetical protein